MNRTEFGIATAIILLVAFAVGWFTPWLLHRFTRVHNQALSGSPVGQIIGGVTSMRPARDVVYDIVEEWIDTNQKIAAATNAD